MIRTYVITLSGWFMRVYTVYPHSVTPYVDATEYVASLPPRAYRISREQAADYLNMVRQNKDVTVRRMR